MLASGRIAAPFLVASSSMSSSLIKCLVRSHVSGIWNDEWMSSQVNLSVRSFFSGCTLCQGALNPVNQCDHHSGSYSPLFPQQRFGFLSSASCSCGSPVQSLPHFLFHCPIYSAHRTLLVEAVTSSNIPWPTSSFLFVNPTSSVTPYLSSSYAQSVLLVGSYFFDDLELTGI